MKTYLKVRWIHEIENAPVLLLSELGADRFETRKVEVFADGRLGFASTTVRSQDTRLSDTALPSERDIAADPQFQIEGTSQGEFAEYWERSREGSASPDA